MTSVQMSQILCCVYSGGTSASQLQVRMGGILASDPEPDVVYASVSRVISYPYYNSDQISGDVALLQLTSPVTFTDTILPICLPSRDINLDQFKVCVDTGFGRTSYGGWYLVALC